VILHPTPALTREAAKQDVFDCIGMFHNPKRNHTNNGTLSPLGVKAWQRRLTEASVWETRGTSKYRLVEQRGIEPLTLSLRTIRSPN
jgi:hypothetical protein